LAGVGAALLTVVAAGLLAFAAVLVLFLVPFLVAFFAVVLVLAGVAAGVAALVAWAANVRGIVATARAIVAISLFFIFSLPAGPSPAYKSIMRSFAFFFDSLRRL
jgi:hypothetical protein